MATIKQAIERNVEQPPFKFGNVFQKIIDRNFIPLSDEEIMQHFEEFKINLQTDEANAKSEFEIKSFEFKVNERYEYLTSGKFWDLGLIDNYPCSSSMKFLAELCYRYIEEKYYNSEESQNKIAKKRNSEIRKDTVTLLIHFQREMGFIDQKTSNVEIAKSFSPITGYSENTIKDGLGGDIFKLETCSETSKKELTDLLNDMISRIQKL